MPTRSDGAPRGAALAASDDGGAKKPSGVRQFVLMGILLLLAAAVIGVFIFIQISRIGTTLDPQKIVPAHSPP